MNSGRYATKISHTRKINHLFVVKDVELKLSQLKRRDNFCNEIRDAI